MWIVPLCMLVYGCRGYWWYIVEPVLKVPPPLVSVSHKRSLIQGVFGDRFSCIKMWDLLPGICGLSRQVVCHGGGLSGYRFHCTCLASQLRDASQITALNKIARVSQSTCLMGLLISLSRQIQDSYGMAISYESWHNSLNFHISPCLYCMAVSFSVVHVQ